MPAGSGVKESQLRIPALQVMRSRPNGYVSTADLIAELAAQFQPTGKDAQIATNRNDTYFSQKVRNLISHKNNRGNILKEGYAIKVDEGMQITPKGLAYLTQLGV